jgi:hypothetical protein
MRRTTFLLTLIVFAASVGAANRQWQTGKCVHAETKRKTVDFGPGASPFGGSSGPALRALADVRTFVIENNEVRLELEDVVPIGKRSAEMFEGEPVTFALEKNSVYIQDADGKEYRLRVTKKTPKNH